VKERLIEIGEVFYTALRDEARLYGQATVPD
jgi:hypothetical protein